MEKRKLWQKILTISGLVGGSWLFLWVLGPVLLPFALGFVVARIAAPATDALGNRLHVPRWAAAGVCVSGIYIALITAVWLGCRLLCREAMGFARSLPALAQSLTDPAQRLEQWLLRLAARFPDGIGHALTQGVSDFFRSGAGLAGKLYNGLFDFASTALRKTPDIALFLLTAVLSSFMIASELPELKALWRKKVPVRWQHRMQQVLQRMKRTLGAWFRTQLKLLGISFLVLTAGFLILQISYPLLFSLAIALIDALPMLGSGAILIPWGLVQFLQGNTVRGTGLLVLYGVTALLRTSLEPRMLGKQMGLDPLLTLLALYGGYHFLGVVGMILFPMGALLIRQFWGTPEKRIDN